MYKKIEVMDILCSLGFKQVEAEEKIKDYNNFMSDLNKETDKIKPNYYHKGNVDTIQFCIENDLDFLQGNVVKYVVRYKEKNGLEDLEKAKEYLDRLIKNELEKSMKEATKK